ncbi:MAG: hypothetical protein LBF67_05955 [Prevotellaceae bacterium]|nr:hypothetical protein [Prevotellaceae bacterium]
MASISYAELGAANRKKREKRSRSESEFGAANRENRGKNVAEFGAANLPLPSAHVVRRAEVGWEVPRLRPLVPRVLRSE